MTPWIGIILDVILIIVVGIGVAQATRLIGQLRDLRAGRTEMDRFVRDFNAAVMRADAGIKSLRATARDSGDDLEKLVSKAVMVRDELNFIVESADGVAERLSVAASGILHTSTAAPAGAAPEKTAAVIPVAMPLPQEPATGLKTESRAEQELKQALKKLS